jgi:membrane-associated phospholipid phosphatase
VRDLPFHLDWIQWLFDHRTAPLTVVMQSFTFLGELEGMVLLVALVFAVWDKRLAIRLAFVTLIAMSLNHLLKTLVANPRPFVTAGTYREHWATSAKRASELVTEYSTPSGHAMGGAAFWGFLFGAARRRWARVACAVAILGTGLSRPYLGVHYLEDIAIGWPLGLAIAWVATRHGDAVARRWHAISLGGRLAIAGAASVVAWALTRELAGWSTMGQPSAFVSYAGFLTGLVAAEPLEAAHVRFDPRSGSPLQKTLRFVLGVVAILGPLALLDPVFAAIAPDATPLGDLLRYVRYAAASVTGLYVAPLVCVKLGLAGRTASA